MYLNEEMFCDLYKAQVRPHVEYANQVWAPRQQKHKESLENVQRRATKLVACLKELSYEEIFRRLKLPILAYKRIRGDVIKIYKILTN